MIYLDGNIQSVLKFYVLPEQQKRKILMNKIKQRQVLKNKIRDIDSSLIDQSENSLFIVTTTLMTVKTHIFLIEQ